MNTSSSRGSTSCQCRAPSPRLSMAARNAARSMRRCAARGRTPPRSPPRAADAVGAPPARCRHRSPRMSPIARHAPLRPRCPAPPVARRRDTPPAGSVPPHPCSVWTPVRSCRRPPSRGWCHRNSRRALASTPAVSSSTNGRRGRCRDACSERHPLLPAPRQFLRQLIGAIGPTNAFQHLGNDTAAVARI